MEPYALPLGYRLLTIAAQAAESRNFAIDLHYDFTEFVLSEPVRETLVLYCRKNLKRT